MDTAKRDQLLMMRAVSLAQKVGQLASSIGGEENDQLAEKRMGWAVAKLLKAVAHQPEGPSTIERSGGLDLPDFITKTELGSSMENLGLFYLQKGNKEQVLRF